MVSGIRAHGTLLKIGDGATAETFTSIAEVTNIQGPGLTADSLDMTHHASPSAFREFVQGLKDGGEVTLDLNYIPTAATQDASSGLLNDYENGTLRNFELVFPDAGNTTWSITGIVTNFTPAAPVDGKLGASVTIKLSGAPTLA